MQSDVIIGYANTTGDFLLVIQVQAVGQNCKRPIVKVF